MSCTVLIFVTLHVARQLELICSRPSNCLLLNPPDNSSDSDTILLDSLGGVSLSPTTALSEAAARSGYRAVVAIDFGTTYSGYAYSFSNHPEDISLMRTTNGGRYGGPSTHKIPTILLLNDKGGFHSFGHEAREAYHDLDEIQATKWLYFEKFKLELHTRKVTEFM